MFGLVYKEQELYHIIDDLYNTMFDIHCTKIKM